MTKFLYTSLIQFYKSAITFVSLFNDKARQKIKGVRNTNYHLKDLRNANNEDVVFIHCASQGEHEQALPVIRWILSATNYNIAVSFYSPSGYNNANYELNPRITKFYLPFDTPKAMSTLIDTIQPKIVIIVKNEWWWNLLSELKDQKIESYLISATIRERHYFIKYSNQFFINGLNAFSAIFVIDEKSKVNISKVFNGKVIQSGDTRIDQVNYIKNTDKRLSVGFANKEEPIIVYGSVWETDLIYINRLIKLFPDAIHLIYPHELDQSNIDLLKSNISNCTLVKSTNDVRSAVNIVTAMGELKYAYQLATFAYIGGGFDVGIHNVLEAAVYNIPTVFGPNYIKSNEAIYLLSCNCSFTINTPSDLDQISEKINKEKIRKEIETKLKSYFSPNYSPTEIICQEIFKKSVINV